MNDPKAQTHSDIVRFGGGALLVIVTFVALIGVLMVIADVAKYFAVRSYEATPGIVTKSRVMAARGMSSRDAQARPVASIDYVYAGESVRVTDVPLGPIGSRRAASETVAEHPVGSPITVYVDPDDIDDPELDNDRPLMSADTLGFAIPSLAYFVYFAGWLVPAFVRNRRARTTATGG